MGATVESRAPGELAERRFRAARAYSVVQFTELSGREQELFAPLRNDATWIGILRSDDAHASVKAASSEVIDLLAALREAGPLPGWARDALSEAHGLDARGLARLVLDGVLEIETPAGFTSGTNAVAELGGWLDLPDIAVSDVSTKALRYGTALRGSDRLWLSGRLYAYNREPFGAAALRGLRARGVRSAIGLTPSMERRMDRVWQVSQGSDDTWLHFTRRATRPRTLTHKLYLSPRLPFFADAFAAAVEEFEEAEVDAFKVAGRPDDLARPDRFVAYLPSLDVVKRLADRLTTVLAGAGGLGVPFTSPLDRHGLLSWGMDPPADGARLRWQGPSWRRWLTDLLAGALIDARAAEPEAAVAFARVRAKLEGINPTSWTPSDDIWRAAA